MKRPEPRKALFNIYKIIPYTMFGLGLVSLLTSSFNNSYVLALTGLGLTFCGTLFIYLKPCKHVRLELLTAAASSTLSNIERILASIESNVKGIYLPPKRLRDYESSLIFIPSKPDKTVLELQETSDFNLYSENLKGLLITPPGLALSKFFERNLGKSFTKTNPDEMQRALPRLFDELEIAKNTSIRIEGNLISIETKNYIFKDLCTETRRLQKTHEIVGCPFSSAIACALAKATGKAVIIEGELQNLDGTTTTTYRLLEE